MARRLALVLACAAALRCSAGPARLGGVRVLSNVEDATIFVDEEMYGTVGDYAGQYVRLSPGAHLLRLEHPDYLDAEINADVVPDVAMTVSIEMRRRTPGER